MRFAPAIEGLTLKIQGDPTQPITREFLQPSIDAILELIRAAHAAGNDPCVCIMDLGYRPWTRQDLELLMEMLGERAWHRRPLHHCLSQGERILCNSIEGARL